MCAPAVDLPPPEQIQELCDRCLQYVSTAVNVGLDFSEDTLPILDHYLRLSRDSIAQRPELRALITQTAGAYFGELVRRRLNGYWQIPNADVHNWRICARSVYLAFNPIGVVNEALEQGAPGNGPTGELQLANEDRDMVAERLALAPPVSEEDYYLLSTRLEAIGIAAEALRMAMHQGGQDEVEFELQDYE
jgi:hypothetical protein